MHGRGRPAQQEPKRPIVWAFLGSLAQRRGMNRPEHRTADRVNDRDHDLRAPRGVEHDPVEHGAAAGHVDELACACRLHSTQPILPRHEAGAIDVRATVNTQTSPKVSADVYTYS